MDFLFQPEPIIWFQQALGYMTPVPFQALSLFGSAWGVLLVLGLALWLWGWRTVLVVAAVAAVEGILRTGIAHLLPVARPAADAIIKFEHVASSPSFPSGHLATAAVLWGTLSALKHVPWWGTAAVVMGTAVARFYLGVHYVADLVAAVVLAALVVWAAMSVEPRVRGWFRRRSFAFHAGIAGVLLALAIASFWFYVGSNPVLWTGAGLLAGAAVSLPLTYRWVRYRPGFAGVRGTLLMALGLAGLVGMVLLDRLSGEASLALGAMAAFLGAVWVLLITPLLLRLGGAGDNVTPEPGEPARRVAGTLAAGAGLIVAVLAWSAGIEPRLILDVERETVTLPELPDEWDGVRVALIADFQIGMWLDNEGMVDRVVERIVRERPDIVLFAGDLVYQADENPEVEVRRALRRLEPLRGAGLAMFAVLGNHDWGLDTDQDEPNPEIAAAVTEGLTEAGFRVLTNEAASHAVGGRSPIFVVGIGSAYAEHDDPVRALGGVPATAPRIVFMHNPSSYAELPPRSAPLALAGHTHGGQVRVPLTPSWSWMTVVRDDPVHADGWIDDGYGAAGNRLYVNRGIGFSILPLRLNSPPELTFFTLRADPPAGRPG